jgi:hypothetical protein
MKLNALLKTLGFLALAATPVVAGTAPAPKNPIAPAPENDDLGINASLGYDSNYVWRGLNYGQHWVRGGLDGSILLVGGASEDGAGSTSLNWNVQYGSLAGDQDHFTGANNVTVGSNSSFQRLQLGAAIEHDFGAFSASLGYTYYRNMGGLTADFLTGNPAGATNGMNDGQEVSLGLATALGPIDISSSANYDFVNDYWYFDLTASTTLAITDSISLVPYATIGYGHNINWQWDRNSVLATNPSNNLTAWTAVTAGLQLPIKLNSRATLTPYIAVNAPLTVQDMSGVATRANLPTTPYNTVVFGGVTLSVRF